MSHELRTPMIGILGYSEILKNLGENQEERDMADTIYRGGTRLLETLNLILDFSRIESDKLSIKYTNVNIVQVANTVLEQFDYLALKKELSIIKQYEDNSIFAESDERLLSLILKNLISNALKFTKQGFVKLEIQRENSFVVLKVKDTGIGISKEDEKIIFNEFRQVSEGFGRGFEGVGLGLTLVKKFVEKMNGLIFTQSKVGVGTEFIVKLPIVQNATVNQEYEIPITSKKRILLDTKKATHKLPEILVVEDDAINQQVIKLYIKSVCAMELAENADDAIKKVKEKNYSAILMDINLGRNSSGLEATKEIRKLDNYKHTPIVAITAFAMAGDKEEFLKAGCTHYLAKPFNRKTLVQLIEEILIKS
jgi:CheY-like chemotaxis protein/two-component sensor histidine kinase